MMDTIRLSVSDIDALRYFQDDEQSDLAQILRRLRRQDPASETMLAGTALHKALELSPEGEFTTLTADGYSFDMALSGEVDLPPIREMKATGLYMADGCLVTLVGKVDAIYGKRVDDHKFTTYYDPERFMDSVQWRAYLDLFEADEFRFNVFEGKSSGPKAYVVHSLHQLTMRRYPGMYDDLLREIRAFVDFARTHLPERLERAAA